MLSQITRHPTVILYEESKQDAQLQNFHGRILFILRITKKYVTFAVSMNDVILNMGNVLTF